MLSTVDKRQGCTALADKRSSLAGWLAVGVQVLFSPRLLSLCAADCPLLSLPPKYTASSYPYIHNFFIFFWDRGRSIIPSSRLHSRHLLARQPSLPVCRSRASASARLQLRSFQTETATGAQLSSATHPALSAHHRAFPPAIHPGSSFPADAAVAAVAACLSPPPPPLPPPLLPALPPAAAGPEQTPWTR